jgi:hypothetical protein
VTIDFENGDTASHFSGDVDVVTFGRDQYNWTGHGPTDLPNPDLGLVHSTDVGGAATYDVAPESLTVFRGAIAAQVPLSAPMYRIYLTMNRGAVENADASP